MDSNDVLWTTCFILAGFAVFLVVTNIVDALVGPR